MPTIISEELSEKLATSEIAGSLLPMADAWSNLPNYINKRKPVLLSIAPKAGVLGFMKHVSPYLLFDKIPQQELEVMLQTMVGPIAADRYFFNEVMPYSTGNLTNASRLASEMVITQRYAPKTENQSRSLKVGLILYIPHEKVQMAQALNSRLDISDDHFDNICVFLGRAYLDVESRLFPGGVV